MHDHLFFTANETRPLKSYYSEAAASIWPKMLSYLFLPYGWHYGSGGPASSEAHNAARSVVSILTKAGARDVEAFPDESGAITLNSIIDGNYFEFLCKSLSNVEVMTDTGCLNTDCDDVEVLNLEELKEYLGNKPWNPVNSFVSFTQANTTTIKKFSPTVHLADQVKVKASQ